MRSNHFQQLQMQHPHDPTFDLQTDIIMRCVVSHVWLFCHQSNKSLHGIFQLSYSIDRDSRNIAEMSKYLIYLQITDLSHNTVFILLFVEIRKSVEIINFPLMFLDEAILRLLLLHFIWCINDPCITYHKLQSFMTILTFENIKVHSTKLHHSIRTLSCYAVYVIIIEFLALFLQKSVKDGMNWHRQRVKYWRNVGKNNITNKRVCNCSIFPKLINSFNKIIPCFTN